MYPTPGTIPPVLCTPVTCTPLQVPYPQCSAPRLYVPHSRTVFELLDADGSGNISGDEFENFGFLFNFEASAVNQIFREFDVSGDQVPQQHAPYTVLCSTLYSALQDPIQCSAGPYTVLCRTLCCTVFCRSSTTRSSACLQWRASTSRTRWMRKGGGRGIAAAVSAASFCDRIHTVDMCII